jgi:hypothetical protein
MVTRHEMDCRNGEARLARRFCPYTLRRSSRRDYRHPIGDLASDVSPLREFSGIGQTTINIQECVMKQTEPPSIKPCSNSSTFRIGKDSRGNWVVQDEQGICGGLFIDRVQALRFAMFENGNRPQAAIMVPGILELDMNRAPDSAHAGAKNRQASKHFYEKI